MRPLLRRKHSASSLVLADTFPAIILITFGDPVLDRKLDSFPIPEVIDNTQTRCNNVRTGPYDSCRLHFRIQEPRATSF